MAVFSTSGEAQALAVLVQGPHRFNQGLQIAGHKAGHILKQTAKQRIRTGSRSGRMYGSHQASAPGEYSAFLTGEHFRSIDYDVNGSHSFDFGAGAKHSPFLELGTSKMEARDDLGKTVSNEEARVNRILGQVPYKYLIGKK